MKNFSCRHGDIYCSQIAKLPKGVKVKKTNVIVSASHDHVLEGAGKIYGLGDSLYLKVTGKANLNHEEHGKIDLPVGVYKVTRQIEFNGYDSVIVED